MSQMLGEYLIIKDKMIVCAECGHVYCRVDKNYKLYALFQEVDLEDLQLISLPQQEIIDEEVILRRFYCPGCGVNIENEVILKNNPPYTDKQVINY
jgi:acetone carboxylase gamma subunit